MAITKRKHVGSKKRKIAWRKYSDVVDVEKFLDEERFHERTGGNLKERPNTSLFLIERKPATEQHIEEQTNVKKKRKRANIKDIKLKCHESLENKSKVECPGALGAHKTRSTTVRDRRAPRLIKLDAAGYESRKSALAREQRVKHRRAKADMRRARSRLPVVQCDLWGAPDGPDDPGPDISGREHIDRVMGRLRPRMTDKQRQAPSALPAVQVCDPGASYNPSYDDHQSLLDQAAEREASRLREEARVNRWMKQLPRTTDLETQERWLSEMSAGLDDNTGNTREEEVGDHVTDGEEGEREALPGGNPAVDRCNVVPRQIRRQRRDRKEAEKQRSMSKQLRQADADYYRLKSIKSSIQQQLVEQEKQRAEKSAQKLVSSLGKPKRLGKLKFDEPDVEVNLCDELTGSLRTLKVEGNLLSDRFHSLQRRSVIEPRERCARKNRYKRKVFKKKE